MAQLPFLLLAGLILYVFFVVSFSSQKLRLPSVLVYIVLGIARSVFFPENEAIFLAGEVGIVLLPAWPCLNCASSAGSIFW